MTQLAYTHTFTAEPDKALRPRILRDTVPVGDHRAHIFCLKTPGAPPAATAYAVRSDGVTVVIPCESGTDELRFSLPAQAVTTPGPVQLLLRASLNDSLVTLLWCVLTVCPGITDVVSDPGELIPSLDVLLAKLADCEAAAAQAREAASSAAVEVEAARAAAESAEASAADMSTALTAVTERMDSLEISGGVRDQALALHGGRLTALEGLVSADSLAALFCPAFSLSGSVVSCHPSPGTTVMLGLAGQDTAFRTAAGSLWSVENFAEGATNYYVTGSNSGGDVSIPAGEWTFSWHLEGTPDTDSYNVFYRLGEGGSSVRSTVTGPDGSVTIRTDSPTTFSLWLYNSGSGWASTGYPPLKAMLSDHRLQDGGFVARGSCVQAGNSFISPGDHRTVWVWTEDGSSLTAVGYEDIPYALAHRNGVNG